MVERWKFKWNFYGCKISVVKGEKAIVFQKYDKDCSAVYDLLMSLIYWCMNISLWISFVIKKIIHKAKRSICFWILILNDSTMQLCVIWINDSAFLTTSELFNYDLSVINWMKIIDSIIPNNCELCAQNNIHLIFL